MNDKKDDHLKFLSEGSCNSLNSTRLEIINNYINSNPDFHYSENDKELMKFIAGECLPIVLVTGLYGTKLQIQITNCTKFHTNYPNISNACNFGPKCEDGFETVFWLSESFENSKDTECTSQIIRLNKETYNKKFKSIDYGFKITFYGNTIKSKSKRECGFGSTSDLLDKFSYFGKTTPRGSKDFKDFFMNVGYKVGINLFASPIDWRLRPNDEYNYKMVKQTVDFAYNVTQKPVILVCHSYGGLVSLSYLYTLPDEEKDKKIARMVTIGTPFLGVSKAVNNFILGTEEFNTIIDVFGFKFIDLFISMENQKAMAQKNPSGFEFFPKDFLMKQENQTYIKIIFKRVEAENKISECITNYYKQHKGTPLFNDNLINLSCIQPILKTYKTDLEQFTIFFPFFPKLEHGCGKRDVYFATCGPDVCPSVWDEYCRLNFFDYYKNNLLEINDNGNLVKVKGTNTQQFIDVTLKYGIGDPDKEWLDEEHKKYGDQKLTDLPHPEIPLTIIFGNFAQTEVAYKIPENPKPITDQNKYVRPAFGYELATFQGGDGSVNALSLLLPPLKWAHEHSEFKCKMPLEIVGYCQNEKYKHSFNFGNYTHNSYRTINCRCDKPQAEGCMHASMLGDPHVFELVKDYAIKESNTLSHDKFLDAINLQKRGLAQIEKYNCTNLESFYDE